MRRRLVVGLIVLNALLGVALFGSLRAQILPTAFWNCCRDGNCCASCCWWPTDCADCEEF